jgi:hypothetical protein
MMIGLQSRDRLLASLLGMVLWSGLVTGLPAAVAQSGQDIGTQPAEQVVLVPSKDNTIYEGTGELASNGAGQYLFAGRTATPANLRALLAFDLSGQVPSGATILTVTLQLNVSLTGPGDQQVALHRLIADWGEGDSDASGNEVRGARATIGDATWVHGFYSDTLWSTLGGDFVSAPSATANVGGGGVHTWSSPGMVADVQGWVAAPGANFGWILVGNEMDDSSAKRFDSRQNPEAATHPRLTIVFEPAPAGQQLTFLPLVQGP